MKIFHKSRQHSSGHKIYRSNSRHYMNKDYGVISNYPTKFYVGNLNVTSGETVFEFIFDMLKTSDSVIVDNSAIFCKTRSPCYDVEILLAHDYNLRN